MFYGQNIHRRVLDNRQFVGFPHKQKPELSIYRHDLIVIYYALMTLKLAQHYFFTFRS